MIFEDRYQAGELLAKKLRKLKLSPKKTVIAAIPRGGVVVAEAISAILSIPIICIVIKKLGAPYNPELAIGATASYGTPVVDRWLLADLGVSQDYLKKEIIKKKKEARAREKFLGQSFSNFQFEGKNVIVVDDGLATGQTSKAAAKIIRSFKPAKLILAVPCASPQAIELVKDDYDNVICVNIDENLMAVGQFFKDFRPIEDKEVKEILNQQLTINQ
jgi:putative phosphoribosyl transferase